MGQYADDIIGGHCDSFGDYFYRCDQRGYKWVPETLAEKNIRKVRKELAILIQSKKDSGDPQAVENARREINLKYGKGWRERGLIANDENQWLPLDQYPIKPTSKF
ncbi:MAG: hypothetical protein GX905_01520 [Bacteroidales bacterium]|nr:hypothetical protein [Bacteroidales bacterium]